MKFFLDQSQKPQVEKTVTNITPAYIELQKHSVDPPGVAYYYIMNWGQYSYFIATCLGREFDSITPYLTDPKMGKAWFDFYKEKWPTWGKLIENGANTRYSNGVLLNIEDPDDGERKWVVGTVVGNTIVDTAENLEKIVLSDRWMQAYALVLVSSITLAQEIAIRPNPALGVAKLYAKQFLQSYKDSIDFGTVWIPKIKNLFF